MAYQGKLGLLSSTAQSGRTPYRLKTYSAGRLVRLAGCEAKRAGSILLGLGWARARGESSTLPHHEMVLAAVNSILTRFRAAQSPREMGLNEEEASHEISAR